MLWCKIKYFFGFIIVKFHKVVYGFSYELNVKTPFDAIEKPVVIKAEPW
ncbi:MAG TPA: hypothetical protein PKI65_08465 [Bacteroidales bacterium]|nr:hypothetical protein [Bacteroidales bacterium]